MKLLRQLGFYLTCLAFVLGGMAVGVFATSPGRSALQQALAEVEEHGDYSAVMARYPGQELLIFTRPDCRFCALLKARMTESGQDFHEIDLSRADSSELELAASLGVAGVPVLVTTGVLVRGYHEEVVTAVLAAAGG